MSILQKIYDGKYSTGHVLTKMPFTLRLKQRAFFDAVDEAMGAEFVQRHRGSLEEAARFVGYASFREGFRLGVSLMTELL